MANEPIEAQKYLSGIEYPATREQLAEHARQQGADDQIVEHLQQMTEDRFDGPDEVSRAISKVG